MPPLAGTRVPRAGTLMPPSLYLSSTLRPWPRRLARLGLAALLLWPAWEIGRIVLTDNLHEIVPGRLYRGGQPTGRSLEALIQRYKIRTVLNVRGCCYPDPWYVDEAETCERHGVHLEDITFSAV